MPMPVRALVLGLALVSSACGQCEPTEPGPEPAPTPSVEAPPPSPDPLVLHTYDVGAPPPAEGVLETIAAAMGMTEPVVETDGDMLVARGPCDDATCRVTVHRSTGIVDARRMPKLPPILDPERVLFDRPDLRLLPTVRDPIRLRPIEPVAPVEPTEPSTADAPVDGLTVLQDAGILREGEAYETTEQTEGGRRTLHLRRDLPLTERSSGPLIGGGITLRFEDDRLVGVWASWPRLEAADPIPLPDGARLERAVDARGLAIVDAPSPFVAFVLPAGPRPARLHPGLLVHAEVPDAPADGSPHDHGSDDGTLTGAHHHGRTLWLMTCRDDADCDGAPCDEGLCTLPVTTTLPRDLALASDGDDDGGDDGDDGTAGPEEDDGPTLFDEEVDPEALCVEPDDRDRLDFSSGGGWSGIAANSVDNGLILADVSLRGSPFASYIASAYSMLARTSRGNFQCRLEAKGDPAEDCHATLAKKAIHPVPLALGGPSGSQALGIESVYCLEGFPAAHDNAQPARCRPRLLVAQRYLFMPPQSGTTGSMDLSDASMWNPAVDYVWVAPPPDCPQTTLDEVLVHSVIDNDVPSPDLGGFFRDPDDTWRILATVRSLGKESVTSFAMYGQPGDHDNYHQKDAREVSVIGSTVGGLIRMPPTAHGPGAFVPPQTHRIADEATVAITIPGCSGPIHGNFKCAHYHWRWGVELGKKFPIFVPTGGTPGAVLTPATQAVFGSVIQIDSRSWPVGFDPTAGTLDGEAIDKVAGGDLRLILQVNSKAPTGPIHLREHFFFR